MGEGGSYLGDEGGKTSSANCKVFERCWDFE